MMFFADLSTTSVIKKVVGVVAVLALIAAAYAVLGPVQKASADVNPANGAMCSFLGGTMTEDGCQIAGTAICILLETHSSESVEAALNLFGMTVDDFTCEQEEEQPTDYCSTVEGVQDEETTCPSQAELDCVADGGTWNSEGSTCTPADNGGGNENENTGGNTENNSGGSSPSGGGLSGGGSMDGLVLGASTDEVCADPLITSYLGVGKNNDLAEVVKLQIFLNKEVGLTLPITGIFGSDTKAAVEQFQVKYATDVLAPWVPFGLMSDKTPTGYVYKTTKRMINKIHCAALDIPMPQLP